MGENSSGTKVCHLGCAIQNLGKFDELKSNYKYNLPLNTCQNVQDVNLKWIIGGVFCLFDFTVGEGAPMADFDFKIRALAVVPRTRYYGSLEGVTPEAKELINPKNQEKHA